MDNRWDYEDTSQDIFSTSTSGSENSETRILSKDDMKDIYSSGRKKNKKDQPKGKLTPKRVIGLFAKVFTICMLVGVITVSIIITSLTIYVMGVVDGQDSLLDIENDVKLSYASIVYKYNDEGQEEEIWRISTGEKVVEVEFDEIPENLKNAFIYTEDQTFYQHQGVNFKRTFAAFLNMFIDILPQRGEGGSTITQQLVKNITNERDTSGIKGVERKIKEIFTAMNVEQHYSKAQILDAYLNMVPLGNNTYGVGAAAKFYFNKSVSDLSLAECACLAAMTKNPEGLRPDIEENVAKNLERRQYVLDKMFEFGTISAEERDTAYYEELVIDNGYQYDTNSTGIQNYFIDALIDEVTTDMANSKDLNFESPAKAYEALQSGGYKIYATVDTDLQWQLEENYKSGNDGNWVSGSLPLGLQSAAVVTDHNGAIKAVAGRIGDKLGSSMFSLATDQPHQIGSTMKPLGVYAPAIEYGLISADTTISDKNLDIPQADGYWQVRNYGNSGGQGAQVTVANALANSLNTVAVQIGLNILGTDRSFEFLSQFNFTDFDETYDRNPSPMFLGSLHNGLRLTEVTAAYQIFANGGTYTEAHTYTKIVGGSGKDVLSNPKLDESNKRILSEQSSSTMNGLLSGVTSFGTAKNTSIGNIPVVGKTGTTDDEHDRLFIGATPDYVAGVWYGFDFSNTADNEIYAYELSLINEGLDPDSEEAVQRKEEIRSEYQYYEENYNKDLKRAGTYSSNVVWMNIMSNVLNQKATSYNFNY